MRQSSVSDFSKYVAREYFYLKERLSELEELHQQRIARARQELLDYEEQQIKKFREAYKLLTKVQMCILKTAHAVEFKEEEFEVYSALKEGFETSNRRVDIDFSDGSYEVIKHNLDVHPTIRRPPSLISQQPSKPERDIPAKAISSQADSSLGMSSLSPVLYQEARAPSPLAEDSCKCPPGGRKVRLSCSHEVCVKCFQKRVEIAIRNDDFNIEAFMCPYCPYCIPEREFYDFFAGQYSFSLFYERVLTSPDSSTVSSSLPEASPVPVRSSPIDSRPPDVECMVCLSTYKRDDVNILGCSHPFCTFCLKEHIQSLMNRSRVSETDLVCPAHHCGFKIPQGTIDKLLDEEWKRKLVGLRLRPLKIGEVYHECPNPRCKNGLMLSSSDFLFSCNVCRNNYCLNCRQPYQANHKCIQSEEEFKQQLPGLDIRKCPSCGEGLIKESGCNFMKCQSGICKGQTFFCWLCSQTLDIEQHYAHYLKSGPYGDVCENTHN